MSDKFDHIIRDHVEKHEYDIDPQQIWNEINKKSKKDKKGFWIWPMSLTIVVLFSVGLYFLLGTGELSEASATSVSSVETKTIPELISELSVSTTQEAAQVVEAQYSQQSKTKKQIVEPEPTVYNSTTSLRSNIGNQNNSLLQESYSSILNNASTYLGKNQETTSQSEQFTLPTPSPEQNLITALTAFDLLNVESIEIPNYRNQEIDLAFSEGQLIQPLSHSRIALSLRSGASLIDRTLVVAGDPELLGLLEGSEQALSNVNSELLVHYGMSSNFRISTGVSYQEIVNLFDWNGTLLTNSSGDVLSIYDETQGLPSSFTGLYYETIDRTLKQYNKSRLIDIPVNLEYAFTGWKLRPVLSVGAAFNIFNSFDGYRLAASGVPYVISDNSSDIKVGIRYSTSLALEYPVTTSLSILGEVGGSLRSIEAQALLSKYRWVDFNLGLKYRL